MLAPCTPYGLSVQPLGSFACLALVPCREENKKEKVEEEKKVERDDEEGGMQGNMA